MCSLPPPPARLYGRERVVCPNFLTPFHSLCLLLCAWTVGCPQTGLRPGWRCSALTTHPAPAVKAILQPVALPVRSNAHAVAQHSVVYRPTTQWAVLLHRLSAYRVPIRMRVRAYMRKFVLHFFVYSDGVQVPAKTRALRYECANGECLLTTCCRYVRAVFIHAD